jgi:hypothetical protein
LPALQTVDYRGANQRNTIVGDCFGERALSSSIRRCLLYSETGHRRRDFLIGRMTGIGRKHVFVSMPESGRTAQPPTIVNSQQLAFWDYPKKHPHWSTSTIDKNSSMDAAVGAGS